MSLKNVINRHQTSFKYGASVCNFNLLLRTKARDGEKIECKQEQGRAIISADVLDTKRTLFKSSVRYVASLERTSE